MIKCGKTSKTKEIKTIVAKWERRCRLKISKGVLQQTSFEIRFHYLRIITTRRDKVKLKHCGTHN